MIPRPEYPRPQMEREKFVILNGEWEFEFDYSNSGIERELFKAERLSERITVPFAPESELSGIGNTDFCISVWYKKKVNIPGGWNNTRTLLHFGAVDYRCTVWINGFRVGEHSGGYTPFSFDITDYVSSGEAADIVVNAYDDTRSRRQPTGKQSASYASAGCFYTRTTGIWQSVWLENVPNSYIKRLKLTPEADSGRLYIEAELNRYAEGVFTASASLNKEEKACASVFISGTMIKAELNVEDPQLWEPGSPVLYDLELSFGNDRIKSYFGFRSIKINANKVLINGKSVFQRLVLDQQFFPEGIYTAPTDESLQNDIALSMKAGFNGARMHMKVFEPRYLYWADKMGYLLWGEFPNWGIEDSSENALHIMLPEWIEAMERDYNHPSIICWCPMNETGIWRNAAYHETVYKVTKALDPTRPCVDTSGYTHASLTDIYDVHDYEQDPEIFRNRYTPLSDGTPYEKTWRNFPDQNHAYNGQPFIVSEYGGAYLDIDMSGGGWGYGKNPADEDEFIERYRGLTDALLDNPAIAGFCYTQLTDVEQEKNGLYTYNRREKFDINKIKEINIRKAAIEE